MKWKSIFKVVYVCDPSLALENLTDKLNYLCGSDHLPLIINTPPKDDELSNEHWKFDKVDWMSFRTLCASRLSDELVLSEDPVAQFTDILIEITKKTFRNPTFLKNKLLKVPWFNGACKQAVKERKKAQ